MNHSVSPHARMSSGEIRASLALAGIFSLRMLGLFMILPVFALYAERLDGVTPALTGLAIGAYGITQALLQIPYGLLSDRFGRRRMIAIGLLIFALGSVVAALADTIYGVIIGRALQGAGAISAVVMALAADLTRDEHRTKAMAIIGMSIGISFSLALVLGPILGGWIGVPGIFWFTAVLAIAGIGFMYATVPQPVVSRLHREAEPVPAQFRRVLRDTELLRLNTGILVLHMVMTATFVVLPLALRDHAGLAAPQHWHVYLPVLLLSVIIMLPFLLQAERRRKQKQVFLGAIATVAIAQVILAYEFTTLTGIFIALVVFYTGFNLLEASLPSLISRMAPPESRGTAMGFFSSAQFFGAFLGGVLGGVVQGAFGIRAVFLCCAVITVSWLLIAAGMRNPRYLESRTVAVGALSAQDAQRLVQRLTAVRGVAEVAVIAEEGVAYLKLDNHALDEAGLAAVLDARLTVAGNG